mmetsp:Transcript_34240/g.59929  ORF Transcript_34240/g.59929 Transcript_34240/m.59929 type:complete len:333 (-) Transcript_34240:1981-2979(-)
MQPTKLFSKTGNSISDRFQILKQSHEILSGQRRKVKVKAFQLPEFKLPSPRGAIVIQEEVTRRKSEKKRKSPSSFFKSQSRDEFYKVKSRKFTVPPCGHYDVNYESVKKRVKTPSFRERTRRVYSPSANCSVLSYSPEHQKRVTSPDFSKQLSRDRIKTPSLDVSEQRFDSLKPEPPISTRVHHVSTPDISKSSDRTFTMYKVLQHSPEYTPSYNLSQPDLGKGIVPFEKVKGRAPLLITHIHDLSYDTKYAFVEKRSQSPDLSKSRQRNAKGSDSLPAYMQHSPTRIGLISVNDKALEMNSFYGAMSPERQSRPVTSGKSQSLGMISSYLE